MNDLPREKLIEIVRRHGNSLVDDARRSEGLFRDHFGDARREISVLTMAVQEGVARDLSNAHSNAPREVLLSRFRQRMVDNLALTEDAAMWAVNSWALALGVISKDELKTLETQTTPKIESVAVSVLPQISLPIQNLTLQTQLSAPIIGNISVIVSAAGEGDFVSINEAIKWAKPGSKILIHPGFYNESIIIDKQVEIVGDGRVGVVVKSSSSSCISMQTEQATVRNLILQGIGGQAGEAFFTVDIERGELTLENCRINSDSLACVAIHGSASNPIIKSCRIYDGMDAGVFVFDNAGGQIENCDIYQNKRSNVVIAQNANPTFKNCRVHAGQNAGFFVYQNGLGTIDDCDIYGHQAGEVVASEGGSPVLRGCKIHHSNNVGVFVQNKGRILLEDCHVYENADAGISFDGASIGAINGCSINANGKVAVRVKGSSIVRVKNSDLSGNRLAAWESDYGVTVENINNND